MSSTTSSTQAGARANAALLPTLGLGGGARAADSEGGGAAFSELLREKIAAPKPEAPRAASPAPAPAQAAKPAQSGAKPPKSESGESRREAQDPASDATSANADDGAQAAAADSAETQVDARNRKSAKNAVGQALKPGSEAARAQLGPDGSVTVSCGADDAVADTTDEAAEELPADELADAGASAAQAILQMLNTPSAPSAKAAAASSDAASSTSDGVTKQAGASTLPAVQVDAAVSPEAALAAAGQPASAQAGLPLTNTAQAEGAATAAGQTQDAAALAASQLQMGDAGDVQARLSRVADALRDPASQSQAGSPGSFASHLQALSNPRSAQANGSSAPAQVALAQALHSPEFAPAMSARLAMLAAEGVQKAQLQLNPAEMGPVSVEITVEGQQAQIAFHAVQADTRQVLEQSLPELAAALRDQGLTLSGGGVFEQSQRQAREQAQQSSGSSLASQGSLNGLPSDAELLSAQAGSRTPQTRSRGVLDLYA